MVGDQIFTTYQVTDGPRIQIQTHGGSPGLVLGTYSSGGEELSESTHHWYQGDQP